MNVDILATLQHKLGRDDCESAVREYQYAAHYINEHWKDAYGKKVYARLQLSEIDLQSLEKRRSKLIQDCEAIKIRLQRIMDEADADAQLQKTKTVSPASGGTYSSGSGGFSRGRW